MSRNIIYLEIFQENEVLEQKCSLRWLKTIWEQFQCLPMKWNYFVNIQGEQTLLAKLIFRYIWLSFSTFWHHFLFFNFFILFNLKQTDYFKYINYLFSFRFWNDPKIRQKMTLTDLNDSKWPFLFKLNKTKNARLKRF